MTEHSPIRPAQSTGMIESLEQQLVALYEEKQEAAASAASIRDTISSLEEQLIELYREKEANGDLQIVLARKEETITSLEAQLVSLYREKQHIAQAA